MGFDVYSYTNRGGRDYNEDSVGYREKENNGIFVVADGLGGHRYGELASACVCDVLTDGWDGSFDGNPSEWLENRIALSNSRVLDLQAEKNAVLKSTVVVLSICDEKAVWANVGDSRLYYIHRSEICGITNDHSVAFKKYKAGEISRDDIRTDVDQSSLLRAIGNEDRNEPELYEAADNVEPGDAFMLCSDGVWEYITDEEVLIDLLKSENAQKWAELLLLRLMDRIDGENDNLTILTVMIV
jgi:serine/threonine protein phosphatase PrpC